MTIRKRKSGARARHTGMGIGVGRSDGFQVMHLPEPQLTFGLDQAVEDPRDGLMLFGPLDQGAPYGIRVAVVGTPEGISLYNEWAQRVQGRVIDAGSQIARPAFPGFETVFRIPWGLNPALSIVVPDAEIQRSVLVDDAHQRVYRTVGIFASRILDALKNEDAGVDVWFVIIPDIIQQNCRPNSRIPSNESIQADVRMSPRLGKRLIDEPSMFAEDNAAAVPYHFEVDFHHQLKARLLGRAPTQIVRESTIRVGPGSDASTKRDMSPFQAAIAWNLANASFYKAGGRPWKLTRVRDGVCYVGLVFKRDGRQSDPRFACCAAQMFLDSGDGLVFRGAVGPWYSAATHQFHLNRHAARALGELVVTSYASKHEGKPPRELFIHGRTFFDEEEWTGFQEAIDSSTTRLVGVRIRDESGFRVYRLGRRPVLRGTALVLHEKAAFLYTRGYTPRLRTYVGREVPRPLRVDIARGESSIETVLADVFSLTKLNYNTCMFADGLPVTLRFADAVGEILTAGPISDSAPLPFKHYI